MIKILLDPGHGPGRAHNRGFIGGNEGDNNYTFSLKLREELLKYANVKVDLTRANINQNPGLSERSRMGKGYDLFLSVHSNAGGGTGSEVFDSAYAPTSNKDLANRLTTACSQVLGIRNRGVKYKRRGNGRNWFGVLYYNQAKSCILMEMFFHDNVNDVKKFKANERKLAERLAYEIARHYGLVKRSGTVTQSSSSKTQQAGGHTMLGNKPVAVISLVNLGDIQSLDPLLNYLYPSYNVVITRSGSFDYANIRSNYIIALGGARSSHTGYANYFISGKNREETMDKVREFISGSKEKFRV